MSKRHPCVYSYGRCCATLLLLSTALWGCNTSRQKPLAREEPSTSSPVSIVDTQSSPDPAPAADRAVPEAPPMPMIVSPAPAPTPAPSRVRVVVPSENRERYSAIVENGFNVVTEVPLSTFSIDVDTASYANVRRFLRDGQRPPQDAVRVEELINYFRYDYGGPTDDTPFATHLEVATCPWKTEHYLARIGIKGKEVRLGDRPPANLVFLIDVSGSMNAPDKLPLVQQSLRLLAEQLGPKDRIAMVVYAGATGVALSTTRGDRKVRIRAALDQLRSGGSTNGGAGIQRAYQLAQEGFIEGGINRVLLATDGDFNVGVTDQGELLNLIESRRDAGVFLTVMGFGRGNLNDSTLEMLADKGNGAYAYIDSLREGRKVLVEQLSGTLQTIAKDVKIQVEFNPAKIASYRLVGYENRRLAPEDFNNDRIDAGEIGAGHTVTALYELVPVGVHEVDTLRYQPEGITIEPPQSDFADELFFVKLRYKQPDGDTSTRLSFPYEGPVRPFAESTPDFHFVSAVAGYGMLLRQSPHRGNTTWEGVREWAGPGLHQDRQGYRAEFYDLVQKAQGMGG